MLTKNNKKTLARLHNQGLRNGFDTSIAKKVDAVCAFGAKTGTHKKGNEAINDDNFGTCRDNDLNHYNQYTTKKQCETAHKNWTAEKSRSSLMSKIGLTTEEKIEKWENDLDDYTDWINQQIDDKKGGNHWLCPDFLSKLFNPNPSQDAKDNVGAMLKEIMDEAKNESNHREKLYKFHNGLKRRKQEYWKDLGISWWGSDKSHEYNLLDKLDKKLDTSNGVRRIRANIAKPDDVDKAVCLSSRKDNPFVRILSKPWEWLQSKLYSGEYRDYYAGYYNTLDNDKCSDRAARHWKTIESKFESFKKFDIKGKIDPTALSHTDVQVLTAKKEQLENDCELVTKKLRALNHPNSSPPKTSSMSTSD